MTPLLWTISLALVGLGLLGIVLPGLPGTPLIFSGLLLTAWADDFRHVSGWTMAFLGVLSVIAFAVDFISGSLGAKKTGASREAVICAALGAVIGLFFGIVGVFFGPGRVGLGAWIGFVVGIAAKLMLVFAMVGIFIIAYVF